MYTLEVGNRVEDTYRSIFVCEIDTMLGDADDSEVVILPIPDLTVLDRLEPLLQKLGRYGDDEFLNETEGFHEFFYTIYDENKGDPVGDQAVEWPFDSDPQLYYKMQYRTYYWYDENGTKFEAKLVDKVATDPRKQNK